MPLARLGAQVRIQVSTTRSIAGVITGFSGEQLSIAPLEDPVGVTVGMVLVLS